MLYEKFIDSISKDGTFPNVIMHITQPNAIIDCLESGLEAISLLPESEVNVNRLQACDVIHFGQHPAFFFPTMVKLTTTAEINEINNILAEHKF